MPEGPEVDTLRRQIKTFLPATVSSVSVTHPRSVRNSVIDLNLLPGSVLSGASRYGKWLFIAVTPSALLASASDSRELNLWVHLRMSGRLRISDVSDLKEKHAHISLHIETPHGPKRLDFIDPRTFGEVRLSPDQTPDSRNDLSKTQTFKYIPYKVLKSSKALKAVLLEQGLLVSGVGNYLADEICHDAKISPSRPFSSLETSEIDTLLKAIPAAFLDFTTLRGTALADEGWRDLFDSLGDGSSRLNIHARQSCRSCQQPVSRCKIAGRSAYFCPSCQA